MDSEKKLVVVTLVTATLVASAFREILLAAVPPDNMEQTLEDSAGPYQVQIIPVNMVHDDSTNSLKLSLIYIE